jgi:hypothetical protein
MTDDKKKKRKELTEEQKAKAREYSRKSFQNLSEEQKKEKRLRANEYQKKVREATMAFRPTEHGPKHEANVRYGKERHHGAAIKDPSTLYDAPLVRKRPVHRMPIPSDAEEMMGATDWNQPDGSESDDPEEAMAFLGLGEGISSMSPHHVNQQVLGR